ncbi:FmdB family transcriptional regulator [Salinibacterium sp. SYSU T00001]|uniref:FmdB family zinc ribbon protein n=1 Tax=Homoserinimonas sedimenticola TaxID=2986805 RepID=UPI002235ABCF|nr:FmdB family zinc ribbon protein [Salinibacterium sedimenticola]MCW4386269.1 FmdB family transcriptional regulator [Salinibacterium sedimenticola]
MPTYAYRCATCEHSFEQYQAFTDDALRDCPACGAPALRKVFNSIGVTFNGSGFYRTDSRSGGAADASGSGSTTGASSSDKASSTSGGGSAPAAAASA